MSYKKPNTARNTVLKVTDASALMEFLLLKMGGMSRTSVKSLLAHRQVSVNHKITTQYDLPLKQGDTVSVNHTRGNTQLTHPKLRILHEDPYIIVVEKKEGLLTESTATGNVNEVTAFSILKNYVKKASPQNRIYIVHRLDRETSGVLVFAKSKNIQLRLQDNWHRVVTRRTYFALVEGKMEKPTDTIMSWLTENPKSLKIHSSNVDNGGQQAITHYKTIKSNEQYSLLEINLETGRKNQIRVHMQSVGHPVAGDKKYGSLSQPLGRIGLHASILEFYHPATNEIVRFDVPVPRTFLQIFRK